MDALSRLNQPLDAEAASWAAGIGDQLAEQLAKLGLLPARSTRRLREFLDAYIAGRANDGATKPTTMVTIRRVADDLVEAMGANRELRAVGAESAEQFKQR